MNKINRSKAILLSFIVFMAMLFSVSGAQAQLGRGWVQFSPSNRIHLDGDAGDPTTFSWKSYQSNCSPTICADYSSNGSSETFTIYDSRSNRSEIRLYNEYNSGMQQFEGYLTFYSPLENESLFQIFGNTGSAATHAMMRGYAANGGEIRVTNGGTLVSGVYGQEVRINMIHNKGQWTKWYVNGQLKLTKADNDPTATHYWKYGVYGSTNGNVPAKSVWRNVRLFRNGTTPGDGVVTLYKDCNYSGWAAGFNVGSHTLSDMQAAGAVNDDVSSVRVASGYQVTLYQSDNYGGSSVTLTGDNSCLTGVSFNDVASSLMVNTLNSPTSSSSSTSSSSTSSSGSCAGLSVWNASSVYVGGNRVQYNNVKYKANWWTQNENPAQNSGQWAVWTNEGSCQ